jgi:hypothetical protein
MTQKIRVMWNFLTIFAESKGSWLVGKSVKMLTINDLTNQLTDFPTGKTLQPMSNIKITKASIFIQKVTFYTKRKALV